MEILNTVFTFVSNNILTKAEFFVGLIVLVGYILLGRKWYETLAGFLKAVVGYMILNVGSAGLINTFRPILAGLNPVSYTHLECWQRMRWYCIVLYSK